MCQAPYPIDVSVQDQFSNRWQQLLGRTPILAGQSMPDTVRKSSHKEASITALLDII